MKADKTPRRQVTLSQLLIAVAWFGLAAFVWNDYSREMTALSDLRKHSGHSYFSWSPGPRLDPVMMLPALGAGIAVLLGRRQIMLILGALAVCWIGDAILGKALYK